MNIRELKRRLLPFQGYRNELDDGGDDLGGDVIDATASPDGAPGPDEDRGDDFTPPGMAPAPAPATAAPAAAAPGADGEGEGDGSEADTPPRGGMIPHARFNEVIAARNAEKQRADAAERELAALRAQQQAPASTTAPAQAPAAAPATPAAPEFNEAQREQDYANALMDGNMELAVSIRAEINRNLRTQAAQEAIRQQRAEEQAERDAEQAAALAAASQQAVKDFPYLDTPEGEVALALILADRDRRVAAGKPISEALTEAVALIAPRFAPQGAATPSRELPGGNAPQDTRTKAAIKRGAEASIAQPPVVQAGVGNRATAAMVDPANMTDEQFNALSEAEKARLRGDNF